jgi:outer-membrane receptor for ferric coprogen and ferric-rhodotorulic acid
VFNPDHHLPQPDDSYYLANATRGGPMDMRIKQYGAYSIARLKLADPLTISSGQPGELVFINSDSVSYWRGEGTPVHPKPKKAGKSPRLPPCCSTSMTT